MPWLKSGIKYNNTFTNNPDIVTNRYSEVADTAARIALEPSLEDFWFVKEINTGRMYLWSNNSWSPTDVTVSNSLPNESEMPGEGYLARISGTWDFHTHTLGGTGW